MLMLEILTAFITGEGGGTDKVQVDTVFEYSEGIPEYWNARALNQYVVFAVSEYTVVAAAVRF